MVSYVRSFDDEESHRQTFIGFVVQKRCRILRQKQTQTDMYPKASTFRSRTGDFPTEKERAEYRGLRR